MKISISDLNRIIRSLPSLSSYPSDKIKVVIPSREPQTLTIDSQYINPIETIEFVRCDFYGHSDWCLIINKYHVKEIFNKHDLDRICNLLGVTHDLLKEKKRDDFISYRRFILYKFIKNKYGWTLKEIGSLFNRDHTTVIHGLNTFDDLYETNKKFRELANKLI